MNSHPHFSSSRAAKQVFTGSRLILLSPNATYSEVNKRTKNAALKLASSGDYTTDFNRYREAFEDGDGIIFETLGVAVVNPKLEQQINYFSSSRLNAPILLQEPERYVYAEKPFPVPNSGEEAESNHKKRQEISKGSRIKKQFGGNHLHTWGLEAIGISESPNTGKGVRIAVLDTGMVQKHPDFAGRKVRSISFCGEPNGIDYNGHGTHCAGIAAGYLDIENEIRYGVASEADLYCLKVLNNAGLGKDGDILAGIEWALKNKCTIISMSLGAPVEPETPWSQIFNTVAVLAMKKGTLLIAAAGNESRRDRGYIAPVNHPANCPLIMAVAALDEHLKPAVFSCAGTQPAFGQIDIAAPGTNIYSSCLFPPGHSLDSGTSMATPFVAGVAALLKQAMPKATPAEIWMHLVQNARRLRHASRDVGAGIAQAPK